MAKRHEVKVGSRRFEWLCGRGWLTVVFYRWDIQWWRFAMTWTDGPKGKWMMPSYYLGRS